MFNEYSASCDAVKCPYCEYEHRGCDDPIDDQGEYECEECGMGFKYIREISVTYYTDQECDLNNEPHKFKEIVGVLHCIKCGKAKV